MVTRLFTLPNLVRLVVLVSAVMMLAGRASHTLASVIGLGTILSLPWLMLAVYSSQVGRREFIAASALALLFPLYTLLLTHGLLP